MKSIDFLKEHNEFIAQDADSMHRDHEVQMAREECYHAADYAIKLHKILRQFDDSTNLDGWVSEKISIASDYLRTVFEYMDYENREQEMALPEFQMESAEKKFEDLVAESATGGSSVSSGFATGPVAAAAPVQRRVKKESTNAKRYGNAVKTKEPQVGKGVY